MWTISKSFNFAAAHALSDLPEGHKCRRLHGHNYEVTVVLGSDKLDPATGFVVDYGDLKDVKEWIDTRLDHQNLSEVLMFPATAENLACFLFRTFRELHPELIEVVVGETEGTTAAYMEPAHG